MNNFDLMYKYTSFEIAKQILAGERIRFTQLADLNDPFEHSVDYSWRLEMDSEEQSHIENLVSLYREETLLLSLSANPLNLLMWAHYANNHCGVVLGIDWKAAALEVDSHTYGRVTYSEIRRHHQFVKRSEDGRLVVKPDQAGLFHKGIHWAYEEEFRIVLPSGTWQRNSHDSLPRLDGRPIYLFPLPIELIRMVIVGNRSHERRMELLSILDTKGRRAKNSEVAVCEIDPYRHGLFTDRVAWGYTEE